MDVLIKGKKTYEVIWYDLDGEKTRDRVTECVDETDAIRKAHCLYTIDKFPAKLTTAIELNDL